MPESLSLLPPFPFDQDDPFKFKPQPLSFLPPFPFDPDDAFKLKPQPLSILPTFATDPNDEFKLPPSPLGAPPEGVDDPFGLPPQPGKLPEDWPTAELEIGFEPNSCEQACEIPDPPRVDCHGTYLQRLETEIKKDYPSFEIEDFLGECPSLPGVLPNAFTR